MRDAIVFCLNACSFEILAGVFWLDRDDAECVFLSLKVLLLELFGLSLGLCLVDSVSCIDRSGLFFLIAPSCCSFLGEVLVFWQGPRSLALVLAA